MYSICKELCPRPLKSMHLVRNKPPHHRFLILAWKSLNPLKTKQFWDWKRVWKTPVLTCNLHTRSQTRSPSTAPHRFLILAWNLVVPLAAERFWDWKRVWKTPGFSLNLTRFAILVLKIVLVLQSREGIFASFVAGQKKKKIHESLSSQQTLSPQTKPRTSDNW